MKFKIGDICDINKSSLNISAETQAMSQPYVIDYTINFDFSPITK